jgi:hypothetical protein
MTISSHDKNTEHDNSIGSNYNMIRVVMMLIMISECVTYNDTFSGSN